jgi:hypothetical protein
MQSLATTVAAMKLHCKGTCPANVHRDPSSTWYKPDPYPMPDTRYAYIAFVPSHRHRRFSSISPLGHASGGDCSDNEHLFNECRSLVISLNHCLATVSLLTIALTREILAGDSTAAAPTHLVIILPFLPAHSVNVRPACSFGGTYLVGC